MNELEAARDRILAAWPTLAEYDRQFILALLTAIADRFDVDPKVQS